MSRGPQTFKQNDLTKACKAVIAAGLKPTRAEVGRDGKIVMIFDGKEVSEAQSAYDGWDGARNAKAR